MTNDLTAINSIRFLGVDAINKANSGHPGIVLGAASMAHVLFTRHLRIDPKNPNWINRDRFILSAGHGSMLLYALNHLSGYQISIEDLKRFRTFGNTPGHPEYGHTDGVEATTGPLGQGISNAVGMAIAETNLAARFNRENYQLIDHYTYCLCGDGDLQEGVALESISLAGHLALNKLIVLFDSNDIQLDGSTSLAFSDNTKKRFEAMNWNHILVSDGEDLDLIDKAIKKAKKQTDKPTIIEIKTIIGKGATKEGTADIHGAPLGTEEAQKLRNNLGWEYEPFVVPQSAYDFYKKNVIARGAKAFKTWTKLYNNYQVQFPIEIDLLTKHLTNKIDFSNLASLEYLPGTKEATRNVSGKIIAALSENNTNLLGGSADLTASTKAKGADGHYSKLDRLGRNLNYGVREHAMGAIANGITLHGGLRTFTGAFFVFSDYMKPTLRLAAIMNIPTIFVFTHDTVAVGEDGPTHQPIEQLTGLRSIPNLNTIRPADANETMAAWQIALNTQNPTAIILTRQNVLNLSTTNLAGVQKGAYVVAKEETRLDGILLASGSEVELAIATKSLLKAEGIDVRVVSMPSHFAFEQQSSEYQTNILPKNVKTLAIEMGSPMSWYKYATDVYGIETYGQSADLKSVLDYFGFIPQKVAEYFKLIK